MLTKEVKEVENPRPVRDMRELCKTAATAHQAGDKDTEELLLRLAVLKAGTLHSPVREAKILNTMGVYALENGEPSKAVPAFEQALGKAAAHLGTENKLYAAIEANLKRARKQLSKADE